ncbi:MAG TPA: glycosyltransferase family 1 protein [Candidatus Udaeobacter sp.]|nr:glycosyltransferase family 1 protein [Candidatus Udaeobacter sp.]
MRIVIVSDAWLPQVNGVVRTLMRTIDELASLGHQTQVVSPDLFHSIPCPTYPEIRLALKPSRHLTQLIDSFQPCAIHIATEGPLGIAARRYCLRRKLPFTTAFHTRFPEYVRARIGLPLSVGYAALRRFHAPSHGVMVSTSSLEQDLASRGFRKLKRWTRGVDTDLFRLRDKSFLDLPRPIYLYVGRIAVEKNIEAFLGLDLPGSKLVVGGGPRMAELARRHPDVRFAGPRQGEDLARHYAASDVFVFPSRTDTFGLVILEALASGLPVAAYPVPGPLDVINGAEVGFLDEDLASAARKALAIPAQRCRDYALQFSWRRSAEQFLANLQPFA